jgi:hypothetical protein
MSSPDRSERADKTTPQVDAASTSEAVRRNNGTTAIGSKTDNHLFTAASESKTSLLDGFEIVGAHLISGAKDEVTQHLARVCTDFATGAVVAAGADLALAGVTTVAGVAASEVIAGVAITGALAYGAYKLGQTGAHLYEDARNLSNPASGATAQQAAAENATNIGGGVVDGTAGLVGGGVGLAAMGRIVPASTGGDAAVESKTSSATQSPTRADGTSASGSAHRAPDASGDPSPANKWSVDRLNSVAARGSKTSEQDEASLDAALFNGRLTSVQLDVVAKGILSRPNLSMEDEVRLSWIAARSAQSTADSIFAACKDPVVVESFAENPFLSSEFLQLTFNTLPATTKAGAAGSRASLADLKYITPQAASVLARDSSAEVRASLAANSDVSLELIRKMQTDIDATVRAAATENEEWR